jgi:GDP-4-dehydro-6-deoxy-D-mannose reductase
MATTTILVTGACGFVGRHLLAQLRRRFPDAALVEAGFDVTDAQAVADGVAETRPTAVFHLAAIAAPADASRDPELAWRTNLGGTLHVARACLEAAPGCTLLFASSADAYGASFEAGTPLDERAPLAPLGTYGATKAAADLALGAITEDGLRTIRLRPFNHTGPGQSDAFVVPAFARQIALIEAGRRPPVIEVGALDPARDFLDVRDVCAAYAAALERADSLPPRTILNLASGTPRRIGDILQDLLSTADLTAEIRVAESRLRPAEIQAAIGDATRARDLLAWSPRIAWQQTIADVLADWRQRISR